MIQKIVGQICENCGVGKYVQNPKTGKVFCSEKCWLNQTPQATQPQQTPIQKFEKKLDEDIVDEKWKKIRDEKSEGQRLGNAKSNATLLVAHGVVPITDWKMWVKNIYEYEGE